MTEDLCSNLHQRTSWSPDIYSDVACHYYHLANITTASKSKQNIKKYIFKRSLTADNPDDDAVADDGDDHDQGEGEGPHHLQSGH